MRSDARLLLQNRVFESSLVVNVHCCEYEIMFLLVLGPERDVKDVFPRGDVVIETDQFVTPMLQQIRIWEHNQR